MLLKSKKSNKAALPADLGIVFVPKEEALWIKVKEAREATIKGYEEALIVERAMLEMAENKLKEIKAKNERN